jgi:arsenate reductase
MRLTIYHNPACKTSCATLALAQDSGADIDIIEYLKTPPSSTELKKLVEEIGFGVRDLLRTQETLYAGWNLDDPGWTDAQLLDIIEKNPILMNRPVVRTEYGTRLCRPPEKIAEILSGLAADSAPSR